MNNGLGVCQHLSSTHFSDDTPRAQPPLTHGDSLCTIAHTMPKPRTARAPAPKPPAVRDLSPLVARVDPAVVAALDARVAALNAATPGARFSRNAALDRILREALSAELAALTVEAGK